MSQPQIDSYEELKLPDEYSTGGVIDSEEDVYVHDHSHFEMIEEFSSLRHVVGATYPAKGIPIPNAIYGINIIKTMLRESAKMWFMFVFVDKNKILSSFNTITNRILKPRVIRHIAVPHKFLCPTAFGVYSIISNFLLNIGVNEDIAENTAYNIAHIFEHDDAWRYRLQDMATSADLVNMANNPHKELERLVALFDERSFGHLNPIAGRVKAMLFPLKMMLYIPKYKHAFMSTLHFIKGMSYDDADWYWVCLRDDYNYGGLTLEERIKDKVIPKRYLVKGGKLIS